MKKWIHLSALALVIGFGAMGCQNTAEGIEQDASKVGEKTAQTVDNAGEAAREGAKDASAALSLTPKVKNAIVADTQLNDPKNDIDVDSADNIVHLKGHVSSAALKTRAGEIAQRVLDESKATDKLSNELQVKP